MATVIRIRLLSLFAILAEGIEEGLKMAASILPEFSAVKQFAITKDKSPLCNQVMPSSNEPTHLDNFQSKEGLHSLETFGQDIFVRIGSGIIIAPVALQKKLPGLVGRKRGILVLDGGLMWRI